MYVPWTQSTYIMAANKKALPYLPKGAKLDALTYDQLAQWAAAVHKATGQRMLGFPAGPTGLMARFLEGYLLPAYTGGVVTTYRSPAAAAMWERLQGAVEGGQSELHQLQLHAGAAAFGRRVDRVGSRRAPAGRVPQAAGPVRGVSRAGRAEGAQFHARARRPRSAGRGAGRGGGEAGHRLSAGARDADRDAAHIDLLPRRARADARPTSTRG